MLKLLVAILKNEDTESVTQALTNMDLSVARIASTGGFFRQSRRTLLIGVEKDKVDLAIQAINKSCAPTIEPISRRATVFLLNVEHFERL